MAGSSQVTRSTATSRDRDGPGTGHSGPAPPVGAHPRGRSPSDTLALDLESVMVNGQRYARSRRAPRREGTSGCRGSARTRRPRSLRRRRRALLGTILGAVVGGGKGAAVGAVAGGAVGAGAQVSAQGHSLRVPSGTVVTFRLDRSMNVGVADSGYTRDGYHYHRVELAPGTGDAAIGSVPATTHVAASRGQRALARDQ